VRKIRTQDLIRDVTQVEEMNKDAYSVFDRKTSLEEDKAFIKEVQIPELENKYLR
jgi:hypothetical protein